MTIFIEMVNCISKVYNERIFTCIDKDGLICVYINNIDKIYNNKYISNLEGRGNTLDEACENYILNIMNKKFNLRYKIKFYATTNLRTIIRKYEVS